MLSSLHIKNYILIDSLDIQFPEGLIIITGQTGAGKSILLGALSLLAGAKADSSVIGVGGDSCIVEAEYNIDSEEVKILLESEDVDYCSGELIVRRTVSASGRSRCFVNDSPVSQSFLSTLSSYLVDIHSQHSSLLLSSRSFQLSVLDNYANNKDELLKCRSLWKELQGSKKELEKLKERLQNIQNQQSYDEAQLKQIEELKISSEDELSELEKEQKALANAEEIKFALGTCLNLFSSSDDGYVGVNQALKDSVKSLEKVSKYLGDSLPSLIERIESARVEIDDIESEVSSLDSSIDISPQRLEAVEDRMSALYSLMKKHSCSSLSELISVREALKTKLQDNSNLEEKIEELEKQTVRLEKEWRLSADNLNSKRCEAAPRLSTEIASDLRFLELENSEFRIDILGSEPGETGYDGIQFLFSANGGKLQDVSKVASGGELSRIMLCLKSAMAKFMGMPTMIFDEIDTGVSGSVADKIGQMICSMGRNMQLLSITHLPQVAAKGDAHYLVSKSVNSLGSVISTLRRIEGEERVSEIARLLSGATISGAALENAKILLSEGKV